MYPNLPSLNSLKTFDAAARLKSFKKAAEEMHVTPTAVSHQIKALEEALGTLLFERKTRAVDLTREGKLLYETSSNIFQLLAYAVNEIAGSKERLTISTTSSFAAMWLVPNLEKFYHAHPGIDVTVKTGEQLDDVKRDRRIDLAIRYGQYDPMQSHTSKLITESFGMYATPDYLQKITNLSDAQLLETKWVNKSLPSITWQALVAQHRHLDSHTDFSVRQFDQEHHVIQAALAGQGIALISSLLVRTALNQRWLIPYTDGSMPTNIDGLSYYLVVPQHNEHNQNVAAFTQWLTTEMHGSSS